MGKAWTGVQSDSSVLGAGMDEFRIWRWMLLLQSTNLRIRLATLWKPMGAQLEEVLSLSYMFASWVWRQWLVILAITAVEKDEWQSVSGGRQCVEFFLFVW